MLLVLSVILLIVGIGLMIWNYNEGSSLGGLILTMFSIFALVFGIMSYSESTGTVREMKELYRSGVSYEEIVENVRESIVIPDITWKQLRRTMIDFIELDKKYTKYNEDFYRLKEYNNNIWLNWSYANLPEWVRADIGDREDK